MRASPFLIALAALACGKVSVEAEGKGCPCPSGKGLECDSVCNTCVPMGSTPGAACAGPSGCVPKVRFSNFRREWATPNTALYRWDADATDKEAQFVSYRLELTPTLPEGDTRIFDASDHPELGQYFIANEGADLNESVFITDLEPQVTYSTRLVVKDVSNCEYAETIQSALVPAPTSGVSPVEIFGESVVGDPIGGTIESSGCLAGSSCFRMGPCQITAENPKCCDNLRVDALSVPVAITGGDFENAYVEFYANNESQAPNRYANTWILVAKAGEPAKQFQVEGWTFPGVGGAYRRLQFPLNEMSTPEGEELTAAILAEPTTRVTQFNWYTCITTEDATAWFDEVYIRW
jgi:hypothetical protein